MRKIAELRAAFEALPAGHIETLLQGQKALILAPHPDDETLGCGGLIAAACAAGVPPIIAVLTDGAASHPGSATHPPHLLRAVREAETQNAVSRLGLPSDHLVFLRYKDTKLPAAGADFAAACRNVALIAAERGCQLLIAPWHGDPHCDHQAAACMAEAVAARSRLRLLSYPVWGWLRDGAEMVSESRRDGWRLDISAHWQAKQQAIAAHASQYGDLITDSPGGFMLPAALLAVFARPFEVYIA
jgi:LmbE family N-acetylglucosaminyl deacetylase